MKLLSRNIKFLGLTKLTPFRKVALGTWRTVGDPSVYSEIEVDVEPALSYLAQKSHEHQMKLTMTHFVGKACAETIRRHPELNCILRWGKLYRRQHIDIFFQVASDSKGEDLSGTTVREIDQKSLVEIAEDMQKKVRRIRESGDIDYKEMKKTMGIVPAWMSRFVLNFSSYFMYTFNLWSPILGVPKDPFGSIMITSLGSIGLDRAFVPLVPYARIPCLIAIGAVRETPLIHEGKITIRKVVSLCITFDHRVIDGMHASHMARTLKKIFSHPHIELDSQSVS